MDDLTNPLSIIYVVAIFFGAGVLLFLGFYLSNTVNQAMLDTDKISGNEMATETIEQVKGYGDLLDYAFLFFILAFLIAMPIAAYFTPSHPALFVGFIFVFFLALTLSVIFSDTFLEFGETEQLEESYQNVPLLRNLMHFLPLLIIVNAVVTGAIMFGKARAGAGEY